MEWKLHPSYGFPYENVAQIQERADNVDLSRVGADHTTKHPILDAENLKMYYNEDENDANRVKDNYDRIKRILVTMALVDNIAMNEAGLCIRWLMPKYDFADGWGRAIRHNEWWVPANGDMFEPFVHKDKDKDKDKDMFEAFVDKDYYSSPHGNQQLVFQTNASVARNDRKCLVLFGFGFGAGASRTITTIKVKHSDVVTKTIISMDQIPEGKAMATNIPIFWKRNDDMCLWATYPGSNWKGKRDNLVVYGFVVETLGAHVM